MHRRGLAGTAQRIMPVVRSGVVAVNDFLARPALGGYSLATLLVSLVAALGVAAVIIYLTRGGDE